MAFRRSLDFLPNFFRSETNSKFLNATLDQLISEPELKRLDGYIGRKFAPSYRSGDGYIDEINDLRQNYQLEPSTIYKDADGKVKLVSTYQDLLARIESLGGITTDQSRLFSSKQYSFNGLFDFDKFSNYASYYWLPNGPDPVNVSSVEIPYEKEFVVTPPRIYQTILGEYQRENFDTTGFDTSTNPLARIRNDGYKIDAYGNTVNPTIRLARGGTYTFSLDQFGHGFYIQTAQGLNTSTSWQQNLSIRDVYGVENNGADIGTITFRVPNRDAQDYFVDMPIAGSANVVARSNSKNRLLRYIDVQYANYSNLIDNHGGLDGQRFLEGKTVVFLKDPAIDSVPVGWSSYTDYNEGDLVRYGTNTYRVMTAFTSGRVFIDTNLELYDAQNDWYDPVPFDGDDFAFDSSNFDRGSTVPLEERTGSFLITIQDGLIKLTPQIQTSISTKLKIGEGIGYGNRQVYHTSEDYLEVVPNITANLDFLYYQDSMDPNIFGIIEIIDQTDGGAIDVAASIIGKTDYVSPNGVTFTNGIKVKFRDSIIPDSYTDKEFYVEGVGTSIELVPVEELATPDVWLDSLELPFDANAFDSVSFDNATNTPTGKDYLTVNRASRDRNAWSRTNRWFHQDVVAATARYNNYQPSFDYDAKAKRPIIEFEPNLQLFNYGSSAKQPVDVIDYETTDAFSDVEGSAVQYSNNDLITYKVDGIPLSPGMRVIFASDADTNVRNKIYRVSWIRPQSDTDDRIAQFTGDGSTAVFDLNFNVTDPVRLSVTVNGVEANDAGYNWSILSNQLLTFDTNSPYSAPAADALIIARLTYDQQIHLELEDGNINENDTVLVLRGLTQQGRQFWVNNSEWIETQRKSSRNQAPLFNLVDSLGNSFGNTDLYPSNNFLGNKIFSYQTQASGVRDPELGLKLKYRNFNNVGDIVFSDFITSGTILYRQGTQAITKSTGGSRVIRNAPDGTVQYLNQWQEKVIPTRQYQTQTFFATQYQKNLFLLNVLPTDSSDPLSPETTLVYVNNRAINNDKFDIQIEGDQGYLLLDQDLSVGDKLDVKIASSNHNDNSIYEIPSDLNYNPLNQDVSEFTLGQMRDHISRVFENTPGLTGEFIGNNNSRDLGNIKQYGGRIVQNLGSTHLANLFLNDVQANFAESLLYSQREYTRYKNKFLELLYNMPLTNPLNPVLTVDEVIGEIASNKSQLFPFYNSDMIAFGNDYRKLVYVISDTNVLTYNITDVIDFDSPNGKAIGVYLNGRLLIKDLEYSIPADRPVIELIVDNGETYRNLSSLSLEVDDILEIREYFNTDGSHIPPTPTKLGLFPSFIPQIISDGREGTMRNVLRGHDGSLTSLFGDHRDDCLLEFERRIYNNLKVTYTGDLHDYRDYIPGGFRNTPYDKKEYDSILSSNFNSWLGKSGLKIDEYNGFDSNDSWTWNYSSTTSKVDGKPMPAAYWREIFKYYFDTDAPHLRPWEMLGFQDEPIWWTFYYGSAPYTRGNTVLWEDLSKGYIAEGNRKGIDARFARPDLLRYIPVDESGNMLSPLDCLVKERNKLNIEGSFVFGDGGPVETAWRQSSEYPFAMQLALALMQPAEYFGANIDKNRQILEDFGINGKQWIYSDNRLRSDPAQLIHGEINSNGDVARVNGYITWISEYAKGLGLDRSSAVGRKLRNSTVQLAYKVAGYTDKKFLKVYADQATPNSMNSSVMIPDDDYDVVLVKSAPVLSITYSGVIITKSANGYTVSGYDDTRPYFTVETSSTSGRRDVISVGNLSAVKYLDSANRLLQVPYGTEFLNTDQVVDFLISYGRYLTRMGFQFTDKLDEDAGFYKDWDLAAREFLFYAQQGWEQQIAISLSPVGTDIKFRPALGSVDGLTNKVSGTRVLTEDYQILRPEDYTVNREGRNFSLSVSNKDQGIYLLDMDIVNYEHVLVFENTTQFADLIYDPSVGARQYRLKIKGFKTGNWDGSFGAAGFIINDDNIEEWQSGRNYYKGDIVLFKNSYYTASENIAGSADFESQYWLKSDYTKVNKGLLPSLANRAGQFKSFYDINSINLELDADRLGKGLIGLRPRSYFENLQISDTSQAKFYQGLITQKGSRNSLDKLLRAKLDNFDSTVSFYEDWAIRSGQYGATGIRQQIQLEIDENRANRDPLLIELLHPNQAPIEGRLSYREDGIWTKSRPFNADFLGTRSGSNLPGYLPTAGYVRLDDVNWTSTSISNLNDQVNATLVGRGDTIYVASDSDNQWSIYRINETGIKLINLTIAANGVATMEFDGNHNLSVADTILVKTINNNPSITAFYSVNAVISNTKITVQTSYGQYPSSKVSGLLYKLLDQRFTDISEVAAREPMLGWEPNDKLFVDRATSAGWGVYEKQEAFGESTTYFPADPLSVSVIPQACANAQFGTSVAINFNNAYMLVGQPGNESVISYTTIGNGFQQDLIITPPTDNVVGFGTKVVTSDDGTAIVAAPNSDSDTGYVFVMRADPETQKFVIEQVLVSDTVDVGAKYGSSIAVSNDGQWLVVGQPDIDGGYIYVYQLNAGILPAPGYQEFIFDASTLSYVLTGSAANPQDIGALVINAGGRLLEAYTDYTLTGSTITFTSAPTVVGGKITVEVIRSAPEESFTGDGSTVSFALTGDSASPSSIYALKVVVDGKLMVPFRDFTLAGNIITFTSAPGNNITINVKQRIHYSLASVFTASDNDTDDGFGYSVDINEDGSKIVVGAPKEDHNGENDAGKVYVFNRTSVEFLADGETTTFNASVQTPTCKVFVDGELADFDTGNGNGDYELDSGDVVFFNPPPAGALIKIENNYFVETALLTANSIDGDNLGISVLMCPTNCSVYAGAPRANSDNSLEDTGKVIRWVNPGRLYGTVIGTVENPVSATDAYLIINDRWIYINSGDTLTDVIDAINAEDIPGVTAFEFESKLRIESSSLITTNKLNITSTDSALLDDLGIAVFVAVQTIQNPENEEYGEFGRYLAITRDAATLVISSDKSTSKVPVTFDGDTTIFDRTMTTYLDAKPLSGAVYTYQYISRPDDSLENVGRFIPAQRLTSSKIDSSDMFGASLAVSNDRIIVGAPGDDTYAANGGIAMSYVIDQYNQAWSLLRSEVPKVNINLINRVSLIDSKNNVIIADLDFIDPFKGKISGIAAQEIEYKVSYDPAVYNVNANNQLIYAKGVVWGKENVGKLWWNTSQARWMEYEQGSLEYRTVNWGTAFPNSTIFCLEWTESTVPPDQYSDPNNRFAFVLPNSRYSRLEFIDESGNIQVRYYFWVGGKTSVPDVPNRKISAVDVESLIANPKAAGVSYAAFVSSNAIALFNCNQYFRDKDVLLSIDYDVSENQDNIHAEYQLVSEGDAKSVPAADIITKLIDSLAGSDLDGRLVPDIQLSAGRKYGKEFRPRQSMFRDRPSALKVAVDYINNILSVYPILLEKDVTNLTASEPLPLSGSGAYDDKVADITELGYVLINVSPIGYKVAVEVDSNVENRWTIYEVAYLPSGEKYWKLNRVQSYVNERFIERIDWVAENESFLTNTDWTVNYNYQLNELLNSATVGQTAKVKDDGRGLYSILRLNADGQWKEIVREAATLRIKEEIYDSNLSQQGFDLESYDLQGFDDWQNSEIQRILRAVYEDIFTVNLEIEKNNWFFVMMQHLLQEQRYVDWLFKTSFIKIEQRQRSISQIPTYQRDNQDLVRQYIEEVKPYHTKIREYILRYDSNESVETGITDFDVPSYYISSTGRYRSPNGSETIDAFILDLDPYIPWRDNHTFVVDSIEIIDGGEGYSGDPEITIYGGNGTGATAVARVVDGVIVDVTVTNAGYGYTETPQVDLGSTSGYGARFAVRLTNSTVRKITNKLKFDRIGTANAGFMVQFKDSSGNPVDVRGELISRLDTEAGVIDYLLDILSQSVVDYEQGVNGNWLTDNADFIAYPVNSIPNYRFFNDASGRIHVLYQTKPEGWNADTLQLALQSLGSAVGVNGLDISGTEVVLDGSMTSYGANVFEWTANTYYQFGDIITNNSVAYRAINNFISDEIFSDAYLERLDGDSFDNHLDRTWAYYQPRGGQLGKDLGQLFSGVNFPGVNVRGAGFSLEPGFDTSAYDTDSYDNFIIGPEGVKVLNPAIMDQTITSSFTDTLLGQRPEDIIVYGSNFLHPYHSHAPEEMVPGRVYDTLSMKVFSTPSGAWSGADNLGLPIVLTSVSVADNASNTYSYVAPAERADTVFVFAALSGRLHEGDDFTVDRVNKTVTTSITLLPEDTVYIYAIDNGGPNMVYTNDFVGDGSTLAYNIPVDRNRINQFYVMINGVKNEDWVLEPEEYVEGVSTVYCTLLFDTPPAADSSIYVYAFYADDPSKQSFTEIHTTSVVLAGNSYPNDYIIELDRTIGYDYPLADKIIVELNGNRLRPPTQAYYTGDGSTTTFSLPDTVYVDPDYILDNSVKIGLNGIQQNVNEHWTLGASDGSTIRTVIFNSPPADGDEIVLSVINDAAYSIIDDNKIMIKETISLNAGDRINVLTFTNHDSIKLRTQVFQGTMTESTEAVIGFDDVGYDSVPLDSITTILSTVTKYSLSRPVTKSSYLWVDLDVDNNGLAQHLNPNRDYIIDEDGAIVISDTFGITPDSIIIVTTFNETAQKPSIGFRIFKDMNDNFEYYRISRNNTTYLSRDLHVTDEWIYVEDASKLPEPGPDTNTPGQIMIGSEMASYYVRDLINNRLGQLRRGIKGTSAPIDVTAGTLIQDISQNQSIAQAHNKVWYDQGTGTATNGLGLQNSTTPQAEFLMAEPTILES